jgi:nicotinamide-nucleotide amidase
MKPRALLILVGDELIRGERREANAYFLTRALFRSGFEVVRAAMVGDDRAAIAGEFRAAARSADLVVVTGGLGPTEDDVTRQAVADALGVDLVPDAAALAAVRASLALRGRPFSERQALQALLPRGARVLANPTGIAPGFWGTAGTCRFVVLVGVPSEAEAQWTGPVKDVLAESFPDTRPPPWKVLHSFGLSEVAVQERLIGAFGLPGARSIGICASRWVISVYLAGDHALRHEVARQALSPHLFGEDDDTLAAVLVRELGRQRLRLGVAESLTGGGVGAAVTTIPGASDVFAGGFIVYTDEAKRRLGVSPEMLEVHGAVSEPCAHALARQARRGTGADIGVGITGFAGPGGGTLSCPVGTVFVAAERDARSVARRILVTGPRASVREVAINYALALALDSIGSRLLGD